MSTDQLALKKSVKPPKPNILNKQAQTTTNQKNITPCLSQKESPVIKVFDLVS